MNHTTYTSKDEQDQPEQLTIEALRKTQALLGPIPKQPLPGMYSAPFQDRFPFTLGIRVDYD